MFAAISVTDGKYRDEPEPLEIRAVARLLSVFGMVASRNHRAARGTGESVLLASVANLPRFAK